MFKVNLRVKSGLFWPGWGLENQEIQETLKKVKTYDLSFETQDQPCHS